MPGGTCHKAVVVTGVPILGGSVVGGGDRDKGVGGGAGVG